MRGHSILRGRIEYSVLIVLVYLLGRSIPIPWVVYQEPENVGNGIQALIGSFLGSSISTTSLFSLGLTPWVTAMVVVSVFQKTVQDKTQKRSPGQSNRKILVLASFLAVVQALIGAGKMQYRPYGNLRATELWLLTAVVLVGGSFLIRWLVGRNTAWGIGGQALIILVNILGNLRTMAAEVIRTAGVRPVRLLLILAAGLAIVLAMLFLEGGEFRNTVRRIGINNLYAADDYIAIRLTPAGTMPVMYVMSFFTLPYYVLLILRIFLPGSAWIDEGLSVLNLNQTAGVWIFGGLLLVLTVVLSVIMVGPGEIARNLEQQGDYLDYMEPGRETALHLFGQTVTAALFSGVVTWLLVIPSLFARAAQGSSSGLYMAPMTIMVAAGMAAELLEEAKVYRTMESYRPFL